MKRSARLITWACIAGYVVCVLYKTVFSRVATEALQFDYHPFWSYAAIMDGQRFLIKEHILNVALFIPLGAMLWIVLEQKRWWIALVFGCGLSACVETMQLLMKRGFCEFDDVMHNTIGCLIGYFLVKGFIGRCTQTESKIR